MSALEDFVTGAGAIRRLRVDTGFFTQRLINNWCLCLNRRQKKTPTESGIMFLHLTCIWRDLNGCEDPLIL